MHQRQGTVKLHRGRKERIQRSFLKPDPSVCPPHVEPDRSLPGCGSSVWVAGDVWGGPPGRGRDWTGAGKEREGGLKCTGDITFKVQRKGEDSFRTTSSSQAFLSSIRPIFNWLKAKRWNSVTERAPPPFVFPPLSPSVHPYVLFGVCVCICQCRVFSSASHLPAACLCVCAYISICMRVCVHVP